MKIIEGVVLKINSQNSGIVEVTRKVPHKIYGKLMKRTSRFRFDTLGTEVKAGDKVKIVETRPISKNKNFKLHIPAKKESKK